MADPMDGQSGRSYMMLYTYSERSSLMQPVSTICMHIAIQQDLLYKATIFLVCNSVFSQLIVMNSSYDTLSSHAIIESNHYLWSSRLWQGLYSTPTCISNITVVLQHQPAASCVEAISTISKFGVYTIV